MPATYTYNDAIDDARAVVMAAFEENGPFDGACSDQAMVDLMVDIGRRLTVLKRPSRRPHANVPK